MLQNTKNTNYAEQVGQKDMNTGNTIKYIDTVPMKWTHLNTKLEMLWIRRHLGDTKFFTIIDYIKTKPKPSTTLPSDVYCDVDVFVMFDSPKHHFWYELTC